MASLADALPPDYLRRQLIRRLVPGVVVKIKVPFPDKPKDKRVVVMSVSQTTICCVINTDLNPLLANNPATKRAQLPLAETDHDFLDHDSFLDCSRIWRFNTDDVIQELLETPANVLGNIDLTLRDAIVGALQTSSTMAPNITKPLCDVLNKIE